MMTEARGELWTPRSYGLHRDGAWGTRPTIVSSRSWRALPVSPSGRSRYASRTDMCAASQSARRYNPGSAGPGASWTCPSPRPRL